MKQVMGKRAGLALLASIWLLVGCGTMDPTPFPTIAVTAVAIAEEPTTTPVTESATLEQETAVTATPTVTVTPGDSPTPSKTPTNSPTPSKTPIPSVTPTSRPQVAPTLAEASAPVTFLEGVPTPSTAVPSPVPTFETPNEITNILLIGSDQPMDATEARTDTMIIVSINQEAGTASMLSLPRDLFVYHPGRTMGRLNTAVNMGGIELLEQSILYNFGIPIHYYAQVDFAGFENVVDAMGGVEIAVSCRLQDWRLISPDLDPQVEENWAQFALEPGVYQMDGDLALWYARSRQTTSDFDRGRRQQQLLRAMLNQAVDLNMVAEAPTLWNTYKDTVVTDLDIGRILQLLTLAPNVRQNGVQHLYLARGAQPWTTPGGAQVQLPLWEGEGNFGETFSRLYKVPTLNRSTRRPLFVEIVNATDNPDLAQLAADNLAWYGFIPVIGTDQPNPDAVTQLNYYRPNFKDSYDWLVSWIAGVRRSQIQQLSDPEFEYDYQLILGNDYNPCLNQLFQPQEFIDGQPPATATPAPPTPTPTTEGGTDESSDG